MKTNKMNRTTYLKGFALIVMTCLSTEDMFAQEKKSPADTSHSQPSILTNYNAENVYIYDGNTWVGDITGNNGRNHDMTINNKKQGWFRFNSPGAMVFWTDNNGFLNDSPNFVMTTDAKFGINTSSPKEKLEVKNGNGKFSISDDVYALIGNVGPYNDPGIQLTNTGINWNRIIASGALAIYAGGKGVTKGDEPGLFVDNDQKVKIGFSTGTTISSGNLNSYNLFIAKGALSEKYGLGPQNSWGDYVFAENYRLASLEDIASYIAVHQHLPNIPSQEEIAASGYSLHEMNVKLLEKIEELTLYAIEADKKNQVQDQLINAQMESIKALKMQMEQYRVLCDKVALLEKQVNLAR